MQQISLAYTGFELVRKHTRKREFLDEMNLVIPCTGLLVLIAPHAPAGNTDLYPIVQKDKYKDGSPDVFVEERGLRWSTLKRFGSGQPGWFKYGS